MNELRDLLTHFLERPNAYRTIAGVALALIVAYWFSDLVAKLIIRFAQRIAVQADRTTNLERQVQLRRVETYMGVIIAMVRVVIVFFICYTVYRLVEPRTNGSTAAIGASAVFIVMAGATIGSILRDVTAGATMIIERWFNVGDHIRVEPFMDVGGVVERMTLRSTKLRSLNGEVVWLHNQYMQGVKVTPHGLRSMAVDIIVRNEKSGTRLVEKAIEAIPVGPLMLAEPLKIITAEQWGEGLYHIEVFGKTAPGREWLIEKFFVDSLKQLDERRTVPVMIREPLARYADADADRNFKRAVRVAKREQAKK